MPMNLPVDHSRTDVWYQSESGFLFVCATRSFDQDHWNLALLLLKVVRGPEAYLENFADRLREGSIHESSKVGRDERI